jgi:threonine dehydratase
MNQIPTFEDIRAAAQRIQPYIHRTPVLTCRGLNRLTGAELFFKCENFQKTGAFKFRGACNAIFSLPGADLARGVATHSSGNHAAAVALAARLRKTTAYIVMPENASRVKRRAVAGYGGQITFCQPTLASREETLADVIAQTKARLIHPYNDPLIIAGQGTAALELAEEVPDLDLVLAPVGGGGLISGTALTLAALRPQTRVIAVEPQGADDAYRSFREKTLIPCTAPDTIADGLRTSLGDLTFPILLNYVHDVVMVSDAAIAQAMRTVWERMKIIIEPSAAVPVAALLEGKISPGRRIGIILSGGNVDLDRLPWQTTG